MKAEHKLIGFFTILNHVYACARMSTCIKVHVACRWKKLTSTFIKQLLSIHRRIGVMETPSLRLEMFACIQQHMKKRLLQSATELNGHVQIVKNILVLVTIYV